jgi:hypothetical protein
MKYLIVCLVLCSVGCSDFSIGTKYKCVDGVVYIRHTGAWIQAKVYQDNKCLPTEVK